MQISGFQSVSRAQNQRVRFPAAVPELSLEWPAFSRATLWPRLVSGEFVIRGHAVTDQFCSLVLARSPRHPARPLGDAPVKVTRTLLVGGCQKVLAIERNLCASTISAAATRCLQTLGLRCTVSRAPLALALAALADHSERLTASLAWWRPARDGSSDVEVWMTRPDETLRRLLSDAEFEIARLSMQGLSHQEIATRRGRSERTVANQLHSIFAKLRVTGRFQLIALSVGLEGSQQLSLPRKAS